MPSCTHGTVLSSLPPSALQRNFDVSFNPFFAYGDGSRPGLRADPTHCWMWAQTDVWSTCLDGPYGDLGCRLLHPAQLGALRGCALLLWCSPAVLILAAADFVSCAQLIQACKAWSRTCWKHGQGHWRLQLCLLPPLPAAFVSAHNVLISLREGMPFFCSYINHIPPPVKESNCIHVQSAWTYQAQLMPAVCPLLSGKSEQG